MSGPREFLPKPVRIAVGMAGRDVGDATLRKAVAGKVVLVTGASSGIGAATARRLGAAGATVLLVARSVGKLDAIAQEITAGGGRAHVHSADLRDGRASRRAHRRDPRRARPRRRPRQQRRALDPALDQPVGGPLPRHRAHERRELPRAGAARHGAAALDARARRRAHRERLDLRGEPARGGVDGLRVLEDRVRRMAARCRARDPRRRRLDHHRLHDARAYPDARGRLVLRATSPAWTPTRRPG